MNIGEKNCYLLNPEDIMSIQILEVEDIYEVGLEETYAEISKKDLATNLAFGEQLDGIYGEQ
jgi:hypothetical protein